MTSGKHDAGPSAVLSVMLTIIVAALFHLFKHRMPIPFTVFMFLFGMVIGGISYGHKPIGDWISVPYITPKSIFFIFLPVLVFDGSAALKRSVFRNVSLQAFILAGPGMLINTTLIAVIIKYAFYDTWTWYAAISLGAALSATDPVAVVSLLRDLDADIAVTTLTDGEAILNDGTAIILFSMCIEATATGSFMAPEEAVWRAILLLLGGFVFGFLWAKLMLFVLKRTNDPMVETMISVGGSYVAFFLADDVFMTSGVITLGVMGMVLAESEGKRPLIVSEMPEHAWEMLVFVGNAIIFALVGFLISSQAIPSATGRDWWVLVLMYIFLVVSRAAMMLVLLPALNYFASKDYQITKERFALLVYGALRGGVGLTLALVMNRDDRIPLEVREPALFITGGVVVFSICFNGSTAFKVVSWLKLDVPPPHKLYSQKQTERIMVSTLERCVKDILLHPSSREANVATVKDHTIHEFKTASSSLDLKHFKDDVTVKPLLLRAMRTELWSLREAELVSSSVFALLIGLCNSAVEKGEFLTTNKVVVEAEYRFHNHFLRRLFYYSLPWNRAKRNLDRTSHYVPSHDNNNNNNSAPTREPFFASPASHPFATPQEQEGGAGEELIHMDSEGGSTATFAPRLLQPRHDLDSLQDEPQKPLRKDRFEANCNVCEALVTYGELLRGARSALKTYSSKNRHLFTFDREIEAMLKEAKQTFRNYCNEHPDVSAAVVTKRTIQKSLAAARKKLHVLHAERGLPRSMYTSSMEKIEHMMYSTSRMRWKNVEKGSHEDVFCSCRLWDPLSIEEKRRLFSLATVGHVKANRRIQPGGLGIVLSGALSKQTLTRKFFFTMGDYFGLRALFQHIEFSEYHTHEEDVEIAVLDEKTLANFCAGNQRFLVHLWSFVGSHRLHEAVADFYPYATAAAEDVQNIVRHGRIFFNKHSRSIHLQENEALVVLHGSDRSGRFCKSSVSAVTGPLVIELSPQSVAYIRRGIQCNLQVSRDPRCPIPFIDDANQQLHRIVESIRAMIDEDVSSSTTLSSGAIPSQIPLLLEYVVSYAAGILRILDDAIADCVPKTVKENVEKDLRTFCETVRTWSTEEQIGNLSYHRMLECLERWQRGSRQRLAWIDEYLMKQCSDACRVILCNLHHHHQFINEKEELMFWERMQFMYTTAIMDADSSAAGGGIVRRQRSMRARPSGGNNNSNRSAAMATKGGAGGGKKKELLPEFHFPKNAKCLVSSNNKNDSGDNNNSEGDNNDNNTNSNIDVGRTLAELTNRSFFGPVKDLTSPVTMTNNNSTHNNFAAVQMTDENEQDGGDGDDNDASSSSPFGGEAAHATASAGMMMVPNPSISISMSGTATASGTGTVAAAARGGGHPTSNHPNSNTNDPNHNNSATFFPSSVLTEYELAATFLARESNTSVLLHDSGPQTPFAASQVQQQHPLSGTHYESTTQGSATPMTPLQHQQQHSKAQNPTKLLTTTPPSSTPEVIRNKSHPSQNTNRNKPVEKKSSLHRGEEEHRGNQLVGSLKDDEGDELAT